MKSSALEKKICNAEQLGRFYDDELAPAERRRVKIHLQHCPDCREFLESIEFQGAIARTQVGRAVDSVDLGGLEDRLLSRIHSRRRKISGWRRWLTPGRIFVPVSAVAAAMILFIVLNPFNSVNDIRPPSAIINSFTGSVTSVMFFETPDTRQTIIWFNEDSISSGENDAVQKS